MNRILFWNIITYIIIIVMSRMMLVVKCFTIRNTAAPSLLLHSQHTTTTTTSRDISRNKRNKPSSLSSIINISNYNHSNNSKTLLYVSPPIDDDVSNNAGYVTTTGPAKRIQIKSKKKKTAAAAAATVVANDPLDVKIETNTDTTTTTATTPTKKKSNNKKKKKKHNNNSSSIDKEPLNQEKAYNVVLTHCTADFDTLASAVGLAKLWSTPHNNNNDNNNNDKNNENDQSNNKDGIKAFDENSDCPTYVILPRGAHPSVARFLSLHEHLFPIRSLKSFTEKNSIDKLEDMNRLGLVDAQMRDRIGPAEPLLNFARRVTIVDHHVDAESDIVEASDYIIDKVGSVSTMIAERLRNANISLTEAEATLLALGIHADTGSLRFDSTTPRDAVALAWVMEQGASQAAIAEHTHTSLSDEQQAVLTQGLLNTNSTKVHGVTVSSVLLSTSGFVNGLAAVTQDALELSSSDVFVLGVVYDAKRSGAGGPKKSNNNNEVPQLVKSSFFLNEPTSTSSASAFQTTELTPEVMAEAWRGGEEALKRKRLRASFNKMDADGSGRLDKDELANALSFSGIIASKVTIEALMSEMDTDGNGEIDFEEFEAFAKKVEEHQRQSELETGKRSSTLILIGRVKSGINTKHVNLNKLFQKFNGGGHPKAASATVRLECESEAGNIMQSLVDELIDSSLTKQSTVGDFMVSPVLSATPDMTEEKVEQLFRRYDVRALPVVDEDDNVIGLVTYKEVAAAKQRLLNKEKKRQEREAKLREQAKNGEGEDVGVSDEEIAKIQERKLGSALKGWMLQHVTIVEADKTLSQVESMFLESDDNIGVMPVVVPGTRQLVGTVSRTDLLRQHRYYSSLHYHNKAFADSIAARKPIIELRKRLKKFDFDGDGL